MTTATAPKARRGRKPDRNAEIRVRLSAKTKQRAEKLFKRHGLSISEAVRRMIESTVADGDEWLPCRMSSHIPNAETRKALEESLADSPSMTWEEFKKSLEEE